MSPLLHPVSHLPLYVLRRISDKFVINSRAISNTTGAPNPGDDQEYLPILIDDVPANDPIYTVVTQVEGPDETSHEWKIKYVVSDKPLAERLAAVENIKRFEVQKHVPPADFSEMVVLTLAAVLRQAKGLQLTPGEQQSADKLVAVAAALTANKANAADIATAVTAGQKPDPRAGYQPDPVAP